MMVAQIDLEKFVRNMLQKIKGLKFSIRKMVVSALLVM